MIYSNTHLRTRETLPLKEEKTEVQSYVIFLSILNLYLYYIFELLVFASSIVILLKISKITLKEQFNERRKEMPKIQDFQ